MTRRRSVLVVDRDADYGRALVKLLRIQGDDAKLATSAAQALRAVRQRYFDLAIVDLLLEGGGTDLARSLARRVGRLMLSVGARLEQDELLETALGFPVRFKAALPELLRASAVEAAARNGTSGARSSRGPGVRRGAAHSR